MSIAQILSYAPHEPDVMNARNVSIRRLVAGRARGERPTIATTTQTRIPGQTPREHQQTVQSRDPEYRGALTACPAVLVSCACPRFTFYWEYALYSHGAAEIIHGNGQPPHENNPDLIPAVCKHLVRVLTTLRKERR